MANPASAADLASQAGRRPIDDRLVERWARRRPEARLSTGPRAVLAPIDPGAHAATLFAIGHGDHRARALWRHLPYGPLADQAAMATWLTGCSTSTDPFFIPLVSWPPVAVRGGRPWALLRAWRAFCASGPRKG